MGAVVQPALMLGASLGGSLFGRKGRQQSQQQYGELSKEAITSARQQREQGASAFSIGAPLMRAAAGYYQRLLGNDRAAIDQAVAPERTAITESYHGANQAVMRGNLRGGARDMALAENARLQAGQLGTLVPQARRDAAAAGGALGAGAVGQGQAGVAGAAGTFSSLLGQAEQRRQFDEKSRYQLGQNVGGFLTSLLQNYYAGRAPKGNVAAPGPSYITQPNAAFAGIQF